jgi:Tol biopolymer transport system component
VPWPTLGVGIAPDSKRTAFIRQSKAGRSDVLITRRHGSDPPQRVLSREGRLADPTWSPDGKWLLVARPGADQWLFINPSRRARVETVGNISRQFAPGASGQPQFPAISGWCCAAR